MLLVEHVDAHYLAAVAAGADVDPATGRAELDRLLAEPFAKPTRASREDAELRAVLGLAS